MIDPDHKRMRFQKNVMLTGRISRLNLKRHIRTPDEETPAIYCRPTK
jgi:hypothetical protein